MAWNTTGLQRTFLLFSLRGEAGSVNKPVGLFFGQTYLFFKHLEKDGNEVRALCCRESTLSLCLLSCSDNVPGNFMLGWDSDSAGLTCCAVREVSYTSASVLEDCTRWDPGWIQERWGRGGSEGVAVTSPIWLCTVYSGFTGLSLCLLLELLLGHGSGTWGGEGCCCLPKFNSEQRAGAASGSGIHPMGSGTMPKQQFQQELHQQAREFTALPACASQPKGGLTASPTPRSTQGNMCNRWAILDHHHS